MWSKTSAWCGQLAFSFVFTSSSPTCTWVGPEVWSLPRCCPKCYLTSEWKSLIGSLSPFSFAFSPAWSWCCGLITDGEVGFALVFRVFFFKCIDYISAKSHPLTAGLFPAGCCAVLCTVSPHWFPRCMYWGNLCYLTAFIAVAKSHENVRIACLCLLFIVAVCIFLYTVNSSVKCLEELVCEVSHLIDLLSAFMKTSSGNTIVIHYSYRGYILGPVLTGKQAFLCIS